MRKTLIILGCYLLIILNFSNVSAESVDENNLSTDISKIFSDINGILPVVKIIPYKYYTDGNVIAGKVSTGIIISEDGLIAGTDLYKDLHLTSSTKKIHEDFYMYEDDYFDIIVNVCFTYSEKPDEPICSGTASIIESRGIPNLSLLKLDSKDIDGNDLNFNYLEYKDSLDLKMDEELFLVGYPEKEGGSLEFIKIKAKEYADNGVVNFSYINEDEKSGSGYAVINQNRQLVGQDNEFTINDYNFAEPPLCDLYSYLECGGGYCPGHCSEDWEYHYCEFNNTQFKDKYYLEEYIKTYLVGYHSINSDLTDKIKSYLLKFRKINESNFYTANNDLYTINFPNNWKIVTHQEGATDYWGQSFPTYGPFIKIVPQVQNYKYDMSTFVIIEEREFPFEMTIPELKKIEENQNKYLEWYSKNGEDLQTAATINTPFNILEEQFQGKYPTLKITANYNNLTWVKYIISNGRKVTTIKYLYDGNDVYLENINEILSSFKFSDENISEKQNTFEYFNDYLKVEDDPNDNWYFFEQYEYNHPNDPIILKGWRKDNEWGLNEPITKITFNNKLDYSYADIDHWYFSYLTNHISKCANYYDKIFYKNEDMIINGRKAYYTLGKRTYDYERKYDIGVAAVFLWDEEENSQYEIRFETQFEKFEELVPEFEKILYNIQAFNQGEKGEYSIPDLNNKLVVPDYIGHKYEYEIDYLRSQGIVNGYSEGVFLPDNTVNRAEFLKIITEGLQKNYYNKWVENMEEKYSTFTDVSVSDWFGKYVLYASGENVVEGYEDGKFHPEREVILAEALKMIFLLDDIEIEIPNDITEENWYFPYMDKAYEYNLLPEGVMAFDHIPTRGEICYIIYHVMNVYDWSFNEDWTKYMN